MTPNTTYNPAISNKCREPLASPPWFAFVAPPVAELPFADVAVDKLDAAAAVPLGPPPVAATAF